jgi:hypothetical protein
MSNSLFENGYALIIGVQNDICAANDADALYQVLIDEKKAGYPKKNVKLLTEEDATKQAILDALEDLKNKTTDKSTVMIYFAGHGRVEENDKGEDTFYLIPNDYPKDAIKNRISNEDFVKAVSAINANKKLLLLDCCHAGSVDDTRDIKKRPSHQYGEAYNQFVNSLDSGSGCITIMACEGNQKAVVDTVSQQGVFTQCLIEGLVGKGTPKENEFVFVETLYHFLSKEVSKRAEKLGYTQTTELKGKFTKFPICRRSDIKSKIKLFIICHLEDKSFFETLSKSLKVYEDDNLIEKWGMVEILPHLNRKNTFEKKLKETDIVIGLISQNSLIDSECKELFENVVKLGKDFVPVIVEPCAYTNRKNIMERSPLPIENNIVMPIEDWKNPKNAYVQIVDRLMLIVQNLKDIE